MSWEGWLALLTAASTAILGYLQYKNSRHATDQASVVTLREQDLSELQDLRNRVAWLEDNYNNLWYYTRNLLDLYYKFRQPEAPLPGPLPTPSKPTT